MMPGAASLPCLNSVMIEFLRIGPFRGLLTLGPSRIYHRVGSSSRWVDSEPKLCGWSDYPIRCFPTWTRRTMRSFPFRAAHEVSLTSGLEKSRTTPADITSSQGIAAFQAQRAAHWRRSWTIGGLDALRSSPNHVSQRQYHTARPITLPHILSLHAIPTAAHSSLFSHGRV